MGNEGLTQDTPVLGQRRRVFFRPQLVQKPGRAFHVREQESDRARRELSHSPSLATVEGRRPATRVGRGATSSDRSERGVRVSRSSRASFGWDDLTRNNVSDRPLGTGWTLRGLIRTFF